MNADVFYDFSVITALLEDEVPNTIVTEMGRWLEMDNHEDLDAAEKLFKEN